MVALEMPSTRSNRNCPGQERGEVRTSRARGCSPPGALVRDRVGWERLRACGRPQAAGRSVWLRGACVCLQRGPPPSCTRSSVLPSPPSYRGPALKPPPRGRPSFPCPPLPPGLGLHLHCLSVCREGALCGHEKGQQRRGADSVKPSQLFSCSCHVMPLDGGKNAPRLGTQRPGSRGMLWAQFQCP